MLLGCGEPMDCDPKLEPPGSPDRDGVEREAGAEGGADGVADCDGLKGGAEETDDSKKRKRKPYRPGKLVTPLLTSLCIILAFIKY